MKVAKNINCFEHMKKDDIEKVARLLRLRRSEII